MDETLYQSFEARVRAHPDRIALEAGGARITFAELAARGGRMAAGLVREGLTPGTPVLLRAGNGTDLAAAVVGAWRAGGVPALQSPLAQDGHKAGAEAVLGDALVLEDAALETVEAGDPPALADPARHGSIIFTSGSSGTPKGICQKPGTLMDGAKRVAAYQGYGAHERILCPVPWSHDYGWGQLLSCLTLGHSLILPEGDSALAVAQAIDRHGPSLIAGVPAVYAGLIFGVSGIEKARVDTVGTLTSTGSRFSPELYAGVRQRFPEARIYLNYGLTETFRSACLMPGDQPERLDSIGRAIPGVEIAVVDDAGQPLPPGEIGELMHIGPGLFDSYIGQPERTAAVKRTLGGRTGVLTGDLGHVDAEGVVRLAGRRDRQVKSMDVGINLDDVERALMASGLLAAVAATARAHPVMGTRIVAHCVLREGEEARALKGHARRAMSKYLQPGLWDIRDALPRTPSGKTDYQALAALEV